MSAVIKLPSISTNNLSFNVEPKARQSHLALRSSETQGSKVIEALHSRPNFLKPIGQTKW